MSSTTTTQTQTASGQRGKRRPRGRGGNRGNARGGRGGAGPQFKPPPLSEDKKANGDKEQLASTAAANDADVQVADDAVVCWICAEPVKYFSVSACNHRTCHVCGLRLRALYKRLDCTFCKEPQSIVIFTTSPDAPFASYTPESISFKDSKLSIFFETEDMMQETLILLRFNCPDKECDYTATGWGDLKLHVRATHGKMMCDLCIRFKKVFSHEHALYPPNMLPLHLPSMPHRANKSVPKESIEGGVHPLCEFCRECFFSDDELYPHMKQRHEECFICKRNDVRDQYFQDYESMERHFSRDHFPCNHPTCLVQKFVVFGSAMDLKAHMVEEHSGDMTSRDKKDARRIVPEFEFLDIGGSSRRGRRDNNNREREQPPASRANGASAAAPPGFTPSRPNGRRRDGFGAHLSEDMPNEPAILPRRASPSPPRDSDPIVAQRYSAFISRLQALAPSNSSSAVSAVKAAVRGYNALESSTRDLISTIWNVLDRNLDDTASIINVIVDYLEDEEKKTSLLRSWNDFKIEQRRQFPDLVPTSVGTGYAGITSGRVLNAKHATATRSANQSSRQVWARVAEVASSSTPESSSAFPHLVPTPRPPDRITPTQPPTSSVPAFRQAQRITPWASSSSTSISRTSSGQSTPTLGASSTSARNSAPRVVPPMLSNLLFPELPAPTATRSKAPVSGNQSLRNILGDSKPAVPAWRQNAKPNTLPDETNSGEGASGRGKKDKGKQKQTLFTLGSFPT